MLSVCKTFRKDSIPKHYIPIYPIAQYYDEDFDYDPYVEVVDSDDDLLRIAGGSMITIDKKPYVAQIRNLINSTILCGGGIVSPDFVLTAASCIFG
jgi:hypothetical protein